MQQKLLSGAEKGLDSVTLLYYMSPWAAIILLISAICTEGTQPLFLLLAGFNLDPAGMPSNVTGVGNVVVLLILSGLNACLLNVANFLVTSYTSAVTLQVLGNVKSCISIAVSVAIFKNHLTMSQGFGVVVCLFGVWLYQQKGGENKAAKTTAPVRKVSEVEEQPQSDLELQKMMGKSADEAAETGTHTKSSEVFQ